MFTSLLTLALATLATSHFILLYPPTAGFDDDLETTSPCGSFTPDVNSSAPSIPVDRFPISVQNVHPVGQWSIRGTISTEAPYNFTEIVPVINTTGVATFCLSYLSAPSEWAGKEGILQVVDNSPDGILYQCAPVKWTSGSNDTVGPTCANSSSEFKATWTTAEGFKGEAGSSSSASSAMASSSTSTGAAAMATAFGNMVVLGGMGLVAAAVGL